MARIGGFRGVRQDMNPSRLEPGQLQEGTNLRFVKAGQLQSLRGDTAPYDALEVSGVGSLVHGLSQIRNPFSGYTNYIFKAGTKVYLVADVDDLPASTSVTEIYDSGSETPISVFSVDDWVYIYDSAGSKKWSGEVGSALFDLDAGNDYSTLTATLTEPTASGDFLKSRTGNIYYHCIRDLAGHTVSIQYPTRGAVSPYFPYYWDTSTHHSIDFTISHDYWVPVEVTTTVPTTTTGAWASGTDYQLNDTCYFTGAVGPDTLSNYYVFRCTTSHTSASLGNSPAQIKNWLWLFWWAPLRGAMNDYLGIFYPDWTDSLPGGLMPQSPTEGDTFTAVTGNLDYIPTDASNDDRHGYNGTYFYRYRYVLYSRSSQGDGEYPLYATPLQDLTPQDTPVEVAELDFIHITYDLADDTLVNGYGELKFEIYRSADNGGYNNVRLVASLSAHETNDLTGSTEYYDTTGDEDLGAVVGAFDIDFISPPESSLAAFAAQRIFVADGRRLYWSYPGYPGRFNSLQQATLNDTITAIVEWAGDVYIFTPSALWAYKAIDEIGVIQRTGSNVGTSQPSSVTAMRDGIYFTRKDGVWAFDGATSRLISSEVNDTWEESDDAFDAVSCHTGRRLIVFRGSTGLGMDMIHGSPDWCGFTRTYPGGTEDDYVLGAVSAPEGYPVLLVAHNSSGSTYDYRVIYLERETTSSDQTSTAETGELRAPKNNQPIAVSISYVAENDLSFTVKVRNQSGAIVEAALTLASTGGLKRLKRVMLPYNMVGEAVWFEVSGTGFTLDDIYVEAA